MECRTASGDSSGSENISWPGLRSSEPPGFRGNAPVCKFHAADHGVNTRVVPPRGFGVAAGFGVVPTVDPGRNRGTDTGRLPPRLCCRVFSARW